MYVVFEPHTFESYFRIWRVVYRKKLNAITPEQRLNKTEVRVAEPVRRLLTSAKFGSTRSVRSKGSTWCSSVEVLLWLRAFTSRQRCAWNAAEFIGSREGVHAIRDCANPPPVGCRGRRLPRGRLDLLNCGKDRWQLGKRWLDGADVGSSGVGVSNSGHLRRGHLKKLRARLIRNDRRWICSCCPAKWCISSDETYSSLMDPSRSIITAKSWVKNIPDEIFMCW